MLKNLDIFLVDVELKSCWSNLVNFDEVDLELLVIAYFSSTKK